MRSIVVRESMRVHLYRCSPPPDIVAAAVSRNRDCAGSLPLAAGPIKRHSQRKLHGSVHGQTWQEPPGAGRILRANQAGSVRTKVEDDDPCSDPERPQGLGGCLGKPVPGGAAGACRAGPAVDGRWLSRLPEPVSLHDGQAVTRARTAERETDLLSAGTGAGAYGEDSPLAARLDGPLRRSLPRCRKWVNGARGSSAG